MHLEAIETVFAEKFGKAQRKEIVAKETRKKRPRHHEKVTAGNDR